MPNVEILARQVFSEFLICEFEGSSLSGSNSLRSMDFQAILSLYVVRVKLNGKADFYRELIRALEICCRFVQNKSFRQRISLIFQLKYFEKIMWPIFVFQSLYYLGQFVSKNVIVQISRSMLKHTGSKTALMRNSACQNSLLTKNCK